MVQPINTCKCIEMHLAGHKVPQKSHQMFVGRSVFPSVAWSCVMTQSTVGRSLWHALTAAAAQIKPPSPNNDNHHPSGGRDPCRASDHEFLEVAPRLIRD